MLRLTMLGRPLWLPLAVLLCATLAACPKAQGETYETVEVKQKMPENLPPDDALSDKTPAFEPWMTVRREAGEGGSVLFNASSAVLQLGIGEAKNEYEANLLTRLHPTFKAALESGGILPSLDMIDRYTKQHDDSLYAGVELAVHEGDILYTGGKQALMRDLLSDLAAKPASPQRDLAQGLIGLALELGGGKAELSGEAASRMQEMRQSFDATPRMSKPLGFYDEDETLKLVFRRDRLLQQPFGMDPRPGFSGQPRDVELAAMVLLAETLAADPRKLAAYTGYQQLAERITNPTSNLDLRDLLPFRQHFGDVAALRSALEASEAWQTKVVARNGSRAGVAFWPFSYSKESVLLRSITPEMLGQGSFMDVFTEAIRSGQVDLRPGADSGWYDYQAYALETLLLPERAQEEDKLLLMGAYRKRLKNAFEALITQRRETHIKQLEIAEVGSARMPSMSFRPEISFEPTLTHYLRTARAYRQLGDSLSSLFGPQYAEVRTQKGEANLPEAIREAEGIFYGLYLLGCCEIGMAPQLEAGELTTAGLPAAVLAPDEVQMSTYPVLAMPGLAPDEQLRWLSACTHAKTWIDGLAQSEIMGLDSRVIVPAGIDPETQHLRCWAVLGVKLLKVEASYATPPRLVPISGSVDSARQQLEAGGPTPGGSWEPLVRYIPVYDFAEVVIGTEPLTRSEFRAICDKAGTKEEAVKMLTALGEK